MRIIRSLVVALVLGATLSACAVYPAGVVVRERPAYAWYGPHYGYWR